MKLNKLLVVLSTIVLTACNGGGGGSSSGGGDNGGGGGGGSYTLGAQWTNQIGSASGVVNTDNISYQPLSNTIYRLNQSNSTLCTISANANSSTAWDCSSAMANFPSGYRIYAYNFVPDENGNMLVIGKNNSNQYAILKYNGSTWTTTLLTGTATTNISFVKTFYNQGFVYGLTSTTVSSSTKQYNFVAFNADTGAYSSNNNINSVYVGMNDPSSNSAVIRNNIFYVSNVSTITATSLANTSNITTYSGGTFASAIGVTNTTMYTCSPISGYTGTGINATLLSNTTGWGNVGYTAYIDVSNYKVYEGCYSMYASENKLFVVGYTNSTSNPAAVFAQ